MLQEEEVVRLVNRVLCDGVAAVEETIGAAEEDDPAVWDLVRRLDLIRVQAVRRVRNQCAARRRRRLPRRPPVHPAVVEFFAKLERRA